MDTIKFIKISKNNHNNKYDYSKSVYVDYKTKVEVICSIHGSFLVFPSPHMHESLGCPTCSTIYRLSKYTRTKEEFINEANIKHNNKYDYSLVHTGAYKEYIKIICPIHGVFEQTIKNHLSGHSCWECYKIKNSKLKIKDIHHFLKRAKLIHRDMYNYSKSVYVNDKTKLIITCKKHGDYEITPNNHYRGNGCPDCKLSKGEIKIYNFLKDNNIVFIRQATFEKCINKRKLKFDFYIPTLNICIEYDGCQHYQPYFGKVPVEYIQKNDKIKTKYCKKFGIKLIRIKYTNYNKIESILIEEILNEKIDIEKLSISW